MRLCKRLVSGLTGGVRSRKLFDVLAALYNLAVEVGDGVAVLVDYVGSAVIADLYASHDIVEEFGIRNDGNAARCFAVGNAVFPDRSRDYDHQFAGHSGNDRLGYGDISFHRVLEVLAVGIVVAVEAFPVRLDDVAFLQFVTLNDLLNYFAEFAVAGRRV